MAKYCLAKNVRSAAAKLPLPPFQDSFPPAKPPSPSALGQLLALPFAKTPQDARAHSGQGLGTPAKRKPALLPQLPFSSLSNLPSAHWRSRFSPAY